MTSKSIYEDVEISIGFGFCTFPQPYVENCIKDAGKLLQKCPESLKNSRAAGGGKPFANKKKKHPEAVLKIKKISCLQKKINEKTPHLWYTVLICLPN